MGAKKYWLIGFLLISISLTARPQTAPGTYWVQLTDKSNTPYSISEPGAYLSERAILRRQRYHIPIIEQDLPISPIYLDSLKHMGLNIIAKSKWFNAVTVYTEIPGLIDSVAQLGFVRQIKSGLRESSPEWNRNKFDSEVFSDNSIATGTDTTLLNYGAGAWQIGMINGHILHNQGYLGQNMIIAVLDAGFFNADKNPAFDSLWMNNQILGTWDFINRTPVQFDKHKHGSQVLSVMASNMPGLLVGSAPKASYYLLRTEKSIWEYPVEEDYWIAGAEYADSVGADLINSSLAYSRFDSTYTDHTYADMDGNTTRITIGADIAVSKGILVVNSAANEALSSWHYIAAPADGDSVLTVGAVDSLGQYASFSSTGPTYDGRVKPNIAAQGERTTISATNGTVIRGSGTSFSSPLICGITACLWQSNRSVPPMELIHIIEKSASQFSQPDSLLGYGIPNYGQALFLLQGIDTFNTSEEKLIRIFPNPFNETVTVEFYSPKPQEVTIQIITITGQIVFQQNFEVGPTSYNHLPLDFTNLPYEGILFLQVITGEKKHTQRMIKIAY